jgi:hypothetical protein
MSGTRPTGGSPAALALITGALLIGLTVAVVQRQGNRAPDAPATPGPTAPTHATRGPVTVYPRCADIAEDRVDCAAYADGTWSLVTVGGATLPVVYVGEEVRAGVRWVTVR